jgi:homoserine O-acetyltransferase
MKKTLEFGANYKEFTIGDIAILGNNQPLILNNSQSINTFPIAYQTYGKLNDDASNAILLCHALTGDQYAASTNPITNKDGWWQFMIGNDLAIDTNKFFVICSNIIGGCMGSFGPKEINPINNKPFGSQFPAITIADMVNAQNMLIASLGIKKLYAVIGGSTGGMQALTWASLYPQKVTKIIALATSYRHSPQNIAFHEVGRQAIINDSEYCGGKYLEYRKFPKNGLALARMAAHITYLSQDALQRKFGRNLQNDKIGNNGNYKTASLDSQYIPEFAVENYLHYQAINFIDRFDANSYIYITKAVDYFDLESDNNNNLSLAFVKSNMVEFCLISFSDDWLFPPSESEKLTASLLINGAKVSNITINSHNGHDSFLIKNQQMESIISGFLNNN